MNKLIKKLFVSLTLLVFCELILLQSIRGSNSRFDSIRVSISIRVSRVYIDRSASLSINPIRVSIYLSDPRNVPRIRSNAESICNQFHPS